MNSSSFPRSASRPRRFLHTADWQIGRRYGQFDPNDAAFLEEARLDAVAKIAAVAREREVDAVLVAGDVFDMQAVADRTIRRLFAALDGFAGPWVLIAGNHDAALADSVWTRARRLGCVPPQVRVPETIEVVALPEIDTAVLAAPLRQRHTYDDVTAAFDEMQTPPGWLRIGLAHGSVMDHLPDNIDLSNPIAADRAQRAALDYLALGDWHGCLRIDPRTWYAGTPETDRFRDNASGAMLGVRLDAPGAIPVVERIDIGHFRWSTLSARIVVPSDVDVLAGHLAQMGAADVVEVHVGGDANWQTWERLTQMLDKVNAQVRSLRVDSGALTLLPDDSDLATLGVSGYVAEVAETLRTWQADSARAAVAREALRLLLQLEREGGGRGGA